MMHELTRSLGLMEEAHMDTQRDAEQMARTIEDLRDAMSKVKPWRKWTRTTNNGKCCSPAISPPSKTPAWS